MQHTDLEPVQPELPNELIQYILSFTSVAQLFSFREASRNSRDNFEVWISNVDNILAILRRATPDEASKFLAYYRHTPYYQALINKPLHEMNAKEVLCYALTRGLEPVQHPELIDSLEVAMQEIKLDEYTTLHLSIILLSLQITFANQMALPIDELWLPKLVELLETRPLNQFVNLCGMNFNKCRLVEANLKGVDLRGVNFTGALLIQADLTGANLEGADLGEANLSGADVNRAYLYRANLENTTLKTTPPWGDDFNYTCKNIQEAIFLPRHREQFQFEYLAPLIKLHKTFEYAHSLSIAIARNALILIEQMDNDEIKIEFINKLLRQGQDLFRQKKPNYRRLNRRIPFSDQCSDGGLQLLGRAGLWHAPGRVAEIRHEPETGRSILQAKAKEINQKLELDHPIKLKRITI